MIIVFDLDDTLYPEIDFVNSGFDCVAEAVSDRFDLSIDRVSQELQSILKYSGRGRVFDLFLRGIGRDTKAEIRNLVKVYREHKPQISLHDGVDELLQHLRSVSPLYLVTDGNRNVQANKCEALNLKEYFTKIYITHRFGLGAAKPSLYCFNKIVEDERIPWEELVYIGDDPHKDFVNLNLMGARTIRVNQGRFKDIEIGSGYGAQTSISKLTQLYDLLA